MPDRFPTTVTPTPEPDRNGHGLEPLMVPDGGAAALLAVSRSFFQQMETAGRIGPVPTRFGRTKRWSVAEMRRWCEAGCPPRERWIQKRDNE